MSREAMICRAAIWLAIAAFSPVSADGLSTCLPDAIALDARENLIKDPLGAAVPMPLHLLDSEWLSGSIVTHILHIIVTEVMGIKAIVGKKISTSVQVLYAVADCTDHTSVTERRCPSVMPEHTSYSIFPEVWWLNSNRQVLESMVEGFEFDDLGSIGYPGLDLLGGMGTAQRLAYETDGIPLEYYRSYNVSWMQPWEYFPGISAIDRTKLLPCRNTSLGENSVAEFHLRFTNDTEGAEENEDGNLVLKCWDDFWWRAPACRDTPEKCVPVITGGVGWFVDTLVMWSAAYNMPFALAVASTFDNYLSLPRETNAMFYSWQPDHSFVDLTPFAVLLPPHDEAAWAEGDRRTGPPEMDLNKVASKSLGQNYPMLRQMVHNMQITKGQMDELLAKWKSRGGVTSEREEACTWILENEATWRSWIPDNTACIVGMGLVDRSQQIVFSRSEAASCQWCPAGSFSEVLEDSNGITRVCRQCPRGQGQALPGQLVCEDCTAGTYADVSGTVLCLKCKPGSRTEEAGMAQCQNCEPGSVAPAEGSRQCTPCSAGTSQAHAGNTTCLLCPNGFFQPEVGSAGCKSCNDVLIGSSSTRGSTNAQECVCPEGFFQRPLTRPKPVCEDCSAREGLLCPGGNGPPLQKAGYWVQVLDAERRDYSVFLCRNKLQCPAGEVGSCAKGREGKACNSCSDGLYPVSDGHCVKCAGTSALPMIVVIVLGIGGVVLLGLLLRVDASTQRLTTLTIFVTFGQLTTALQAVGTLSQLNVRFVDPAKTMLAAISLLTFDMGPLGSQCFFQRDDPIIMFAAKLLVLPILASMLFCTWWVCKMFHRRMEFAAITNAVGFLTTVFFISITLSVLLPMQCRQNPNGSYSMSTEPGVECFGSSEHWALAVMAGIGVLVYPVAILTWATWATLRYPALARTEAGLQVLKCQRFFFARFRPEKYYFSLVFLVRNTLVPLIPVALVGVPEVQCSSMCFVLQVTLCMEAGLWPWRTFSANFSAIIMNIMLVMAVVSVGPIMDVNALDARGAVSWYVMVCTATLLVSAVVFLAAGVYNRFRPSRRYGAFLCHYKAGAGALARQIKMLLQFRTSSCIFLDSDELDDLERLFDTVRCDTWNLVVIQSGDVLSRVWCAGEIATACRNSVTMVPLAFDDFEFPSDSAVQETIKSWSQQEWNTLMCYDIDANAISLAYSQLREQPRIEVCRSADRKAKNSAVQELVGRCRLPLRRFAADAETEDKTFHADTCILGATSNKEVLSTCEILQMMLQESLQVPIHTLRPAEDYQSSDRDRCSMLFVVLTRGVLEDPAVAGTLLEVTMVAEYHDTPLHLVPVLADKYFQFPTQEDYVRLEQNGLSLISGPALAEAYRELFSNIALPFSPLASEAVLKMEVSEICRRRLRPMEMTSSKSLLQTEDFIRRNPSKDSSSSRSSVRGRGVRAWWLLASPDQASEPFSIEDSFEALDVREALNRQPPAVPMTQSRPAKTE